MYEQIPDPSHYWATRAYIAIVEMDLRQYLAILAMEAV